MIKDKTKKFYYNDKKLVKKGIFGTEIGRKFEDNFIEVKVLGETFYQSSTGSTQYFLIESSNKTKKEIHYSNLFISKNLLKT